MVLNHDSVKKHLFRGQHLQKQRLDPALSFLQYLNKFHQLENFRNPISVDVILQVSYP